MTVRRFPRRPERAVRLILVLLLLLSGARVFAAGFSAEVDRSRIAADQTLRLHVVADGSLSGDPDFSPLQKDFEVVGSSSGTSTTMIVNGGVSTSRSWTLELLPRRAGQLEIPVLTLGGERTAALPIQVLPAGKRDASSGPRPLFLDTSVDSDSPYVQQGFVYRVKVLFREQPHGPTLSEPQADDATFEQLGDDKSYSEMVDGQRYQVIERRYWVIPQKSGPLTIHSPRLEARLADSRSGRRSPFADFEDLMGGRLFQGFPDLSSIGGGRRVIERGPDQSLQVRPQPADAPSPWIPAESLELADEWSPSPPRFKVGEPVTRTITMTARGLTAAQLPTLDIGDPHGANVYPDAPQSEDLPGDTPVSLKSLKVALVPTSAGALTLPEIRLHWWDTQSDKPRVAVIPQRTVQVAPGAEVTPQTQAPLPAAASAPAATPLAPAAAPGDGLQMPVPGGPDASTAEGGPASGLEGAGPWPWVALVLGLGWLATLVWMIIERRRIGRSGARVAGPSPDERSASIEKARRALATACTAGDPKAARSALMDWGRAHWGRDAPRGLGELAARLGGDEVRVCLDRIDQAIYARNGGAWDGVSAGQLLSGVLESAGRGRASKQREALPGLYPQGV